MRAKQRSRSSLSPWLQRSHTLQIVGVQASVFKVNTLKNHILRGMKAKQSAHGCWDPRLLGLNVDIDANWPVGAWPGLRISGWPCSRWHANELHRICFGNLTAMMPKADDFSGCDTGLHSREWLTQASASCPGATKTSGAEAMWKSEPCKCKALKRSLTCRPDLMAIMKTRSLFTLNVLRAAQPPSFWN